MGSKLIRVNGVGLGSDKDVRAALTKSLKELVLIAEQKGIFVLLENHGMIMPNGQWSLKSFSTNDKNLFELLLHVNHPYIGALPDFGNFGTYYRYQGVIELLPYAHGISAKSHAFDYLGEETNTDYRRIFEIINNSNFDGYIDIEFESVSDHDIPEFEGIKNKGLILKYKK